MSPTSSTGISMITPRVNNKTRPRRRGSNATDYIARIYIRTKRLAGKMHHMKYTHIIVGAGSAGCVVAARIAENKHFNVLLLEAGLDCKDDGSKTLGGVKNSRRVPMRGQSEVFDSNIDWNVQVTLADGGSMHVPQAKLVGGGSSINGGIALRSTMTDSKEWVELGNDAWDFESVHRLYESLEGDQLRLTNGPHPITRATASEYGKIQQAFLDAATATGFPLVQDLNATGAEGVGPSPICRKDDRRVSAAETFMDPIRDAPNFTIMSNAQVDKILFEGNRACAVLLADGHEFLASHEIVICAGAIFSPAILQRSGVGPSNLLQSIQVPLVKDLPVGQNLSDHPCIPVVAKPRSGMYQDDDYSLQIQSRWSSTQNPGAIDLQLICFSYLYAAHADPTGQSRSLGGTAAGHVAGVGCILNKPISTGKVAIRSGDVNEQPDVMPNYLYLEEDRRRAREVVRRGYLIMSSASMRGVLEEPLIITQDMISDDDLLDKWISTQYSSTYHFTGSCRMARLENGGVVDQNGRVYGLQALRVADASIIPTIPAGNTMWTTMMFAERIGRSVRDGMDVESLRDSSKL